MVNIGKRDIRDFCYKYGYIDIAPFCSFFWEPSKSSKESRKQECKLQFQYQARKYIPKCCRAAQSIQDNAETPQEEGKRNGK